MFSSFFPHVTHKLSKYFHMFHYFRSSVPDLIENIILERSVVSFSLKYLLIYRQSTSMCFVFSFLFFSYDKTTNALCWVFSLTSIFHVTLFRLVISCDINFCQIFFHKINKVSNFTFCFLFFINFSYHSFCALIQYVL